MEFKAKLQKHRIISLAVVMAALFSVAIHLIIFFPIVILATILSAKFAAWVGFNRPYFTVVVSWFLQIILIIGAITSWVVVTNPADTNFQIDPSNIFGLITFFLADILVFTLSIWLINKLIIRKFSIRSAQVRRSEKLAKGWPAGRLVGIFSSIFALSSVVFSYSAADSAHLGLGYVYFIFIWLGLISIAIAIFVNMTRKYYSRPLLIGAAFGVPLLLIFSTQLFLYSMVNVFDFDIPDWVSTLTLFGALATSILYVKDLDRVSD